MIKKQYIQPAAKVVRIQTDYALLLAMSNVETQGLGEEDLVYDPENEEEEDAEYAW